MSFPNFPQNIVYANNAPKGLSFGRWLWYAVGFLVIYWVMPARYRVWFLLLVTLGALTRPGVLDRLKKTLGG